MNAQQLQDHLDRLDPDDMFAAIQAFPDQFLEGWVLAADLDVQHRAQDLDHVVLIGMGGSAIAGDLVRTLVRDQAPVPMTVVRDYTLPKFVGPNTLVIASSYSGNTEETLSAFEAARDRGAAIYAITSGGALLDHATQHDLPHIVVPGGMQPRAALGYSLGVLLRTAEKLGLAALGDGAFEEALDAARRQAARLAEPAEDNPALHLADMLHERFAVVYTGPGLMEAVGVRFRNQIHENAKQPAWGNVFAELNHNEIMGWEAVPQEIAMRAAVVVLRDPDDHPQIQRRMEITQGLVEDTVGAWAEVTAQGDSPLARVLTTVQLGDFVSFYLALRAGQDPTPVGTIETLKKKLA